jgi:NADH-quinone oxidoreductase subunit C
MSDSLKELTVRLRQRFAEDLERCTLSHDQVTIQVPANRLIGICRVLNKEAEFAFEMLMDLSGIDYLAYGVAEWATDDSTKKGFSRGVEKASFGRFSFHDAPVVKKHEGPRFAVAYQLLSISNNLRLRIKVFCEDDNMPMADSVTGIWASANWYEREAFDLFGIMFEGHPDLRRLLTDYGFIGHPFRKDFPLIGHVEMRYDPEHKRVIYQPVSIEPRVLVPKVIRHDHRYIVDNAAEEQSKRA